MTERRIRIGVVAVCAVLASELPAAAQRSRRLDCPGPVRARDGARRTLPPVRWELGAGVARPFLYRNGAATNPSFRFNALTIPYAAVTGYVPLAERLEFFAGLALTQTWQGLSFHYTGAGGALQLQAYAGAMTLTLPVGLRYRASDALGLSAGPYLSYSTHRGPAGETIGSIYAYTAPDDLHRLNAGLRLSADIRLSQRLSMVASAAADVGMATPSSGTVDLSSSGEGVHTGRLEPYLLHVGMGLTYRLRPAGD